VKASTVIITVNTGCLKISKCFGWSSFCEPECIAGLNLSLIEYDISEISRLKYQDIPVF
jgi:hypothetical protein